MAECWVSELGRIDYRTALDLQSNLVALRMDSKVPDTLLLLEHPHIYTSGRRLDMSHVLLSNEEMHAMGIGLVSTDRGGDIMYHGPGQLVGYPIIKIGGLSQIKTFLNNLEEVLIRTVKYFGIEANRLPGHPGVWYGLEKLGAIGLRVSRGITKHGFSLNVTTDLSYFCGIVPCGIHDKGVTSMAKILEQNIPLHIVRKLVILSFSEIFNLTPVFIGKDKLIDIGFGNIQI